MNDGERHLQTVTQTHQLMKMHLIKYSSNNLDLVMSKYIPGSTFQIHSRFYLSNTFPFAWASTESKAVLEMTNVILVFIPEAISTDKKP
jgi:hypothetical protein